jgi:hypothetical protein
MGRGRREEEIGAGKVGRNDQEGGSKREERGTALDVSHKSLNQFFGCEAWNNTHIVESSGDCWKDDKKLCT